MKNGYLCVMLQIALSSRNYTYIKIYIQTIHIEGSLSYTIKQLWQLPSMLASFRHCTCVKCLKWHIDVQQNCCDPQFFATVMYQGRIFLRQQRIAVLQNWGFQQFYGSLLHCWLNWCTRSTRHAWRTCERSELCSPRCVRTVPNARHLNSGFSFCTLHLQNTL